MTGIRVLASGIDSLYASVRGELVEGLLMLLAELRRSIPDSEIPLSLSGGDPDLLLRRFGWRNYPFRFSSSKYELFVGAPDPFPPVYLQLHAEHIHTVGVEAAVHDAETMLVRDLFPRGCRPLVSRADVFVDEQGWMPEQSDFTHFCCRAMRRRMLEVTRQAHAYGGRFSGFTFGKGDLLARIYNKTLENAVTRRTWPELLWEGRDPGLPVWRVEFQFRRSILAETGLMGMDDAVRHRQGLWDYGCRWLSLRAPSPDSNRGRRPVASEWAQLASARIGGSAVPLIRERVREAEVGRLTQGLVGYASSLEAADGAQGLGRALVVSVPTVPPYLAHRGASFEELVRAKRERRLDGVGSPTLPGSAAGLRVVPNGTGELGPGG